MAAQRAAHALRSSARRTGSSAFDRPRVPSQPLWATLRLRPIADWGFRLLVLRQLLADASAQGYSWHLVTAVFMAPFILLAPINGAISNGLPKRWVLVGSSAVALLALLFDVVAPELALSW